MKTLILAAIRCSLMFLVTASLFSVQPAQAYTVTMEQMGANVVVNGSGPINLTGLTFQFTTSAQPGIIAFFGVLATGPFVSNVDPYTGLTGPTNFGSGGVHLPDTGSGDFVEISGIGQELWVPQGYVSGDPLSDSMTFNHQTLASLGVTPGTYVWTWGTGLPNQNFTLIIGGAVPDGGSTVSLLGFALVGLAALRRKLS